MRTPIYDFARRYAERNSLRLHMPGHKGRPLLGVEPLDITEIDGADVLYGADGIIRESEENAARLFGSAKTLYSAEGSSLAIRAMLYLAVLYAKETGRRPLVAAGRNAHKTFMSAAALLDFEVAWLFGESRENLMTCSVTPEGLERFLEQSETLPVAVYLTSPDYLGNCLDIAALAEVCHARGVLLLVDNAHGAYLRFLPESLHALSLGADACCDSAHKTLPVLTGGAYLHLSHRAPALFSEYAEQAMSLFASTSPSYLILQSLDLANRYLSEGYSERLSELCDALLAMKARLRERGFSLVGNEPMKLTIAAKAFGYTGFEIAEALRREGIECELCDADFITMMPTPEIGDEGLAVWERALLGLERREEMLDLPPSVSRAERALSIRQAMLSTSETLPAERCVGRVLASAQLACPPAVPIVVCGERIDERAVRCMQYYGISSCRVVKEK